MADNNNGVQQFVESLPDAEDIKRRIADNKSEGQILRQMLRMSQRRQIMGKPQAAPAGGA